MQWTLNETRHAPPSAPNFIRHSLVLQFLSIQPRILKFSVSSNFLREHVFFHTSLSPEHSLRFQRRSISFGPTLLPATTMGVTTQPRTTYRYLIHIKVTDLFSLCRCRRSRWLSDCVSERRRSCRGHDVGQRKIRSAHTAGPSAIRR